MTLSRRHDLVALLLTTGAVAYLAAVLGLALRRIGEGGNDDNRALDYGGMGLAVAAAVDRDRRPHSSDGDVMAEYACNDADAIQRGMAINRAWAAAADRGCHKLDAGRVCETTACPVCKPLAFAALHAEPKAA